MREHIIENKKTIASLLNESPLHYIVYFLNTSNDIIYIGRKKGTLREVEVYITENAEHRMADSYFLESISPDKSPEDIHAERVLMFQPYGNQSVPTNNIFISATKAKEDYRIDLRQFKRFFSENGGYTFNDKMYVLKSELQQAFGISGPYSKQMPRVGYIVFDKNNKYWEQIKGVTGFYGVMHSGWRSVDEIAEEDGSTTTVIKEKWPTIGERIERMEEVLSDSYRVKAILSSEVFIAIHTTTNAEKTFSINSFGAEWANGPMAHEIDKIYTMLDKAERQHGAK